ncbi:class I SAM-dependent methyltransferase [Oceanobacillus massiliensis]|uniref:class I SAM-dependent methyltransferase n=1 Tax=Oceanobacillus massiliensis TaxID=1465765 RepID=UPI0002899F3D|nr:class I SAM-dependent methyltransferase [Oceanobacillus massiliensis]
MTFNISNIEKLLKINNISGHVYGSETLSLFLYTLIKREKLSNIVELGTGLGTTSLWICQALMENNKGNLTTIDNGRDIQELVSFIQEISELLEIDPPSIKDSTTIIYYQNFIYKTFKSLNLDQFLDFKNIDINLQNYSFAEDNIITVDEKIDMLFADIAHGPDNIIDIFRCFLPLMNDFSHILIDSASTKLRSYLTLEQLVADLNKGKVSPRLLSQNDEQNHYLIQLVTQRKFRLNHLTEKEKQTQNSTAWITLEPVDYRPNPEVTTLP